MKAWKEDRWLKNAIMKMADGTSMTVECPQAAKVSLARNANRPEAAKVPTEFRTKEYGQGARWCVRWRDNEGRPHKRNISSSQEADALVAELEDDIRSGKYVNPRDAQRKFGEVANLWAATLQGSVKGSTENRYRRELRIWVLPRWRNVPIGTITKARIQLWVSMLTAGNAPYEGITGQAKSLSPSYIRSIVSIVFRGVLEYAVSEGWLARNPAVGVKMPKQQVKVPRVYLTIEEIDHLCSVMQRKDQIVVKMLAFTGLRIGEALALRVGEIDYRRHLLHVDRTLSEDRNRQLAETLPKGNRTRVVPLPAKLETMLHELTDGHDKGEYVVRAPQGGRQQLQNWRNRIWAPALRAAGMDEIEGLTIHSLRHTYASLAIARGADVKTLQAVMGHASAAETLDTYADLWPDRSADVALAIDEDIMG